VHTPVDGQLDLFDPLGQAATTTPSAQRVRVIGDLFHGRVPEGAVYVGRGTPGLAASPYANPFRVGTTATDRGDAVRKYRDWLLGQPKLLAAARAELRGRDLACWFPRDGRPCHGDVLLALVNNHPG
jgi:hypothetical protein